MHLPCTSQDLINRVCQAVARIIKIDGNKSEVDNVTRKALSLVLFTNIGFPAIQGTSARQDKSLTETRITVRKMVDTYVQSIVDADVRLGATVWSPTPDVSFIEPRGTEQGWESPPSSMGRPWLKHSQNGRQRSLEA
jgi:hypothetical protein